jgi:hypothetical protein
MGFSRVLPIACLCLAACGPTDLEPEPDSDSIASESFGLDQEPAELIAFARTLKQGNFGADPAAINVGGVLHVYSTSRGGMNIPHMSGANPADIGTLGTRTEALPDTERGLHLDGAIWAPTIRHAGDHFALWYSGGVAGTDKKCLWRATATNPEGPFHRVGDGAPICPDPNWNIDPYLHQTPQGFWLYSKIGPQLQRRRLNDDGLTFAPNSSWDVVLSPTQSWEQGDGLNRPLVENPAMVQLAQSNGRQRWLFFYSANAWRTKNYAIGYADCGNGALPGACKKETLTKGWMTSGVAGARFGPGAASFFGYRGRDYMITHGWQNRCDDPADTCRSAGDPCPAGTRDNDCRFENSSGRSLYLFRVGLGAGGNPIAKAL